MKTERQILEIEATTNPNAPSGKGYATEARQGSDYFQWAHNTYLSDLHGLFFHIPNEITRAKGETKHDHMMRIQALVAQGLTSGEPDYIYVGEPIRGRPAWGIELKLPNGTVGKEQVKIHDRYTRAGIPVYIVRDFTTFKNIIEATVKS